MVCGTNFGFHPESFLKWTYQQSGAQDLDSWILYQLACQSKPIKACFCRLVIIVLLDLFHIYNLLLCFPSLIQLNIK